MEGEDDGEKKEREILKLLHRAVRVVGYGKTGSSIYMYVWTEDVRWENGVV